MKGRHGLRIGSLFAGIGGLELGLEWAGVGHVVWQVELEPFARGVLAKHWPDADRSVTDVRKGGRATLAPVDLICGGFPCQDVSYAGKGEGLDGARSGLWREFARVIRELRPRYVCIENVAALFTRGFQRVLWDLFKLGYDAEWTTLRASDVGAPHRRERIFIVAHRPRERRDEWEGASSPRDIESIAARCRAIVADAHDLGRQRCTRGGRKALCWTQYGRGDMAHPDGGGREGVGFTKSSRKRSARGHQLDGRGDPRRIVDATDMADAASSRREGSVCESSTGRAGLELGDHALAYADGEPSHMRDEHARWQETERARLDGEPSRGGGVDVSDAQCYALRSAEDGHGRRRGQTEPRDASAIEGNATQSRMGGDPHGFSDRVDRWPSGPGEEQKEWEPPRAIPSKTDPHRRPRLKALGNSVVPQCAYEVGLYVRALLDTWQDAPSDEQGVDHP